MLKRSQSLMIDLVRLADAEIGHVLEHGGHRSRRPWDEVSGVRTIVLDGVDRIADAWSPVLARNNLAVELVAVFCHSRPQVTFSPQVYTQGTGRCELADLLVVIDQQRADGSVADRRAVLIQAKRNKHGRVMLGGDDWTQHELLSTLPRFHFLEQSYDMARPREIGRRPVCGRKAQTAEYGGIEIDGTPRTWTSLLPRTVRRPHLSKSLDAPLPLAHLLTGMAFGDAGCGRRAKEGANDDWSFTVDELLRVTGAIAINARADKRVLRHNGKTAGAIVDTASYLGVPPGLSAGGGPVKPFDGDPWPEGPMSSIHLSLRAIEPDVGPR